MLTDGLPGRTNPDQVGKDALIRAAGGIDRSEVSVEDMERGPSVSQREAQRAAHF